MTRKSESEDADHDDKPTLKRKASSITSRLDRILAALNALDETRLRKLTTQIGPDELAVALLDADSALQERVASLLEAEQLEVYRQYLDMGKDKLPSSVIDGVQGKLLRLAH